MSSHHIVREKQEPALLIMQIEQFDEEYLGQLLEWSPTILVSATEVEKVLSLGIKIDAIFTINSDNLNSQEHVKILPAGKDLLASALKYLVAEGFPAVNIITHHFQAKEYLFYVDLMDLVIFNKEKKIYPIKTGFSKWLSEGEDVFVLHPELIQEFSFTGLKRVDDTKYQTLKDGFFSFAFAPPFIFIAEKL